MTAAIFDQEPRHSFVLLSASIQESFTSIDRFEMLVSQELRKMRDERIFLEGGYASFEKYCEQELSKWGGYRRVNQLLGAQLVIDVLKGSEFDGVIRRESHARPLLKLVKTPEKLKQAVAIACEGNLTPTATHFKSAVQTVEPASKKSRAEEQLFLKGTKIKITSQNHPSYEQEGTLGSYLGNSSYTVHFADGEVGRALAGEFEVTHSKVERIIPPNYAEAIAERDEQHKRELERVEEEVRIRLETEAEAKARQKVQEQLEVQRAIAQSKTQEVIKLQQEVDRLRSLQQLEEENKRLHQEVENLKTQLQQQATKQWEHPLNKDAAKFLNAEVKSLVENLEPELHLRSLASKAPSNCEECLRLMAIALGILGDAMNSTQVLEAAAMLLGGQLTVDSEQLPTPNPQPPTPNSQLPTPNSQLPTPNSQLPTPNYQLPTDEALVQIRSVILNPNCTWDEFWEVVKPYQDIKKEWWRSLSTEEQAFIKKLKKEQDFKERYGLYAGVWVSGSDPYATTYNRKGIVERINVDTEQIFVWWRVHEGIPKDRNHYEPKELMIIDTPEQFVEF